VSIESEKDYLNALNEPQRAAVLQSEGPVMIIAGAGSGKTRVLTYRIAYLLEKGVDAFNILALTFTNKAAKEMRERIEKVAGSDAKSLWMGTFHSVFAKILRFEAEKLGYPNNFTIYDTDDSKSLIKSILKEFNLDDKKYKPGFVLSRISAAKNALISPQQYINDSQLTEQDAESGRPKLMEIYAQYAERCFRAGAMDFDDLLFKTNELLTRFPDVLNKYQQKFHYVMVDEFQDTNQCQYSIIKKLAAVRENICVVGDDAQSIYAFRGATIKNILNFEKDYPDLKVFKLEQNYRSTQNIVNASGVLIKKNKDQLKKNIWTDNDEGERIKVIRAASDNEEGKIIAQKVFDLKALALLHNKDFAILYRTNAQSRAMEEALRKQNIPYRIYGGMSFYQRKEVKDMLAYLRVVVNPHDEEALKRIINYPKRGIGGTTEDKLVLAASQNKCSIWTVLEHIEKIPAFESAVPRLADFRNMMQSFMVMKKSKNAYDLAIYIAKQCGLLKLLHEDKTVEGISRYENLAELLNGIKEFVEDDSSESEKLLEFYLQDIALLTDLDNDKQADQDVLKMMTIHASKGLEFPVVFVIGMEENLFPSQLSLGSRQELEEERRLFYVALTRAEKQLFLSYALTRFRFGSLNHCEPSRFLSDIEAKFLEHEHAVGQDSKKPYVSKTNERQSGLSGSLFAKKPQFIIPGLKQDVPDFEGDDTSSLAANDVVAHFRFGKGKVLSIEGKFENRKATIEFEETGIKQLILRFAKLKILEKANLL
jgi:DNA helicase-2/ATP-dependent DNA helicase PcrA